MKLKNIVNAYQGLIKLTENLLPALESFKLAKLINKVRPDVENYSEQKNKLLEKYGERVEETDRYHLEGKGLEDYKKEIEELENIDIVIDMPKIRLPKNSLFCTKDLIDIIDFIEIEE